MTSTAQLRHEIEILSKALTPDVSHLRFSTWGEFNEYYLSYLTDDEIEMYWRITYKFSLIHSDQKQGRHVSMHDDVLGYIEELNNRLNALLKPRDSSEIDKVMRE